ncbi:hypothetical protein POL68_28980 [Stigmatella sp. ncwal1]|uniref:Lipoprotein n=1 Tax=Stigmatella ashevillensis TaxID=2995309 RepID=A0ABT5DJK8_9BACT|nr:hypothetical protein [Stigmatella ashevillena]MDC0712532.1 hypothetical protein [Stigmatella ashevillena]
MRVFCRSWHPVVLSLCASLLIGLVGCEPALIEETAEETARWGTREEAIRIPNSLTTQALVFNALSTNKIANRLLGTKPLAALFSPPGDATIANQLWDPAAQQFMHYLVGCALANGQNLEWTDPSTGALNQWHGQLGICPAWKTQVPTPACLQQVSSCLLARNNAFGMRVDLSMRGEHPTTPSVFQLEQVTRPSEYDAVTSQRLASFEACGSPALGVQRNCGWSVDGIGLCQPGMRTVLGAGGKDPATCTGSSLGSTSGAQMMLRVCEGITGCNHQSEPAPLAQSEGSCSTPLPSVAFTCPAGGYFNVMKAPYNSTQTGAVTVKASPTSTQYPLSEAAAFRMREGAFYGTIFEPDALAAEVFVVDRKVILPAQPVKGSVYRRMYSCYDSAWNSGGGTATYRVCALPDATSNCAAQVTGVCVNPSNRSYPASKCATDDGPQVPGDGDYEGCRDNNNVSWPYPITTFLNSPCDILGGYDNPTLCSRPREAPKSP